MKTERLVKEYDEYDEYDSNTLTDTLLICARDFEDAMLAAGASPEKDYDYKFIFDQASRLCCMRACRDRSKKNVWEPNKG